MFDGEEDEFPPAKEIQQEVVVDHKLSEIIGPGEERLQLPHERSRLTGSDWMLQEVPPGIRKTGEHRDDVVEESVEQALKRRGTFGLEEALDRVKIAEEVLGKDRGEPPTGHTEL